MRVTISNIEFEVDNTAQGSDEMFERISRSMEEFQVYFSHLIVDGVEVAESPDKYISDNLTGIREVNVAFLSAEQYLSQVMTILETFLEKALPAMKEVADEFYGKPDDGTWERFTLSLHGLQSLVEIVNSVIADPTFSGKVGEFDTIGGKIGEELLNLKDAAEREDMTAIADILHYEIIPFVESLHKAVLNLSDMHSAEIH